MGKVSRKKKKKSERRKKNQPLSGTAEKSSMDFPQERPGSFWRTGLIVFIFGFGVRLLFLFQYKTEPFFDFPILDSELYSAWARTIAEGNWIGEEVFFVSPLYAYFLAILYTIMDFKLFLVILTQFLLGALNCFLVYLIGRKLFGEVVGIIAALIASLYGYFLFLEVQLLKNSLAYLLTTMSFYLFLLAKDKQKPLIWGVLGMSTALTALAIPNILLIIPFLYGALIFETAARQKLFLKLALLTLGIIMVIAPVAVRNYLVAEDRVLISSNGGINLFLGTDPETDGGLRTSTVIEQAPQLEEQSSRRIAEKDLRRSLKPSEVSGYWYSRAWDNMIGKPSVSVKLFLRKLYRFWNWRELIDNIDFYFFREKYLLLNIPFMSFGIIAPLAFLGLWFSRRKKYILIPALAFVTVFTLSSIPFPIYGRYRTPLVPILIVFAAYGLYVLYKAVRERRLNGLIPGLVMFVVLLTVINLGSRENNFAFMYRVMGQIHMQKSEPEKALLALQNAVQADPRSYYTRNALGSLFSDMGRYDEAIEEFRHAIKLSPGFVDAHYNLGIAYFKSGDRRAAFEEFKIVMKADTTGTRKNMIRQFLSGSN
jgi:4-amino-4-deoxy-L-arabinose transferase-like glycosyltransferase